MGFETPRAYVNPENPKFKKTSDLPKSVQDEFTDVEGGFLKKEALENEQISEMAAIYMNTQERDKAGYESRRFHGFVHKINTTDKMDVLATEATEMNTLREELLEKINNRQILDSGKQKIRDEFNDDKEVMTALIGRYPDEFKYASEKLKNDREFCLLALEENPSNHRYMPQNIRSDRDIVLKTLKKLNDKIYFGTKNFVSEMFNDINIYQIFKDDAEVLAEAAKTFSHLKSKDEFKDAMNFFDDAMSPELKLRMMEKVKKMQESAK